MKKTASPALEPEIQDFFSDLFAASAALQSVRRAVARWAGIGGTELAILFVVARQMPHGPVSVRQVAQHLHLAGSNITADVGNLVDAGYLEKTAHPDDSRAVRLIVTAQGQHLLDLLAAPLKAMNAVMFTSLPRNLLVEHGDFYRGIIQRTPSAIAALNAFGLDAHRNRPRGPAPRKVIAQGAVELGRQRGGASVRSGRSAGDLRDLPRYLATDR